MHVGGISIRLVWSRLRHAENVFLSAVIRVRTLIDSLKAITFLISSNGVYFQFVSRFPFSINSFRQYHETVSRARKREDIVAETLFLECLLVCAHMQRLLRKQQEMFLKFSQQMALSNEELLRKHFTF